MFDSVAILSILLYSVLQPEKLIWQPISVGVLTSWQPPANGEAQQEMGAGEINEVSEVIVFYFPVLSLEVTWVQLCQQAQVSEQLSPQDFPCPGFLKALCPQLCHEWWW